MSLRISRRSFGALAASALVATQVSAQSQMKIPVPGTGRQLDVGDDFEDEKWSYNANTPKASYNIDKQTRLPGGMSANERWFEAALRGQPDVVKRVPTPPGGLEGSTGALMLATLRPGVPGKVTGTFQQDDFLANVREKMGGYILVTQMPNCTCRVWIPSMDKWEARYGSSFGYRIGLRATHYKVDKETKERGREEYWPGFFLQRTRGEKGDVAQLLIRSDERGQDLHAKTITEPGWWTLGMSLTPNGQVHYFGKPGVEDLEPADYLGSHFPYGYKAYVFDTFFFNVITQDDGRSWSTGWIIDDPALYLAAQPAVQTAARPSAGARGPAPVSIDNSDQAPPEPTPMEEKPDLDYYR
jgi:hypothetical protein